jgi:isocitrate dehydrogenase (NAD+)
MGVDLIIVRENLDETEASRRILRALDTVYREGKHVTRDVGGPATTRDFTEAVIAALGAA